MTNFKLVIVGGGTAGWFTALLVKKIFKDASVTLIESKELGIVGVGEATTPHIPQFLKYLDFDISDILRETNGTIKNGIRFDNWNGDGKNYFHGFSDNLSNWSIPDLYTEDCDDFFLKLLIAKNLPFDDYLYQHQLAKNYKIDLKTAWAMHFDATALANYLEKEGIKRGINVIHSTISKINNNEKGFITSLKLIDQTEVRGDFFFDCSGFHRLLIGKHYQTKWLSYSKWLPMKKGIPFWLPKEDKTRPYTQAIAMKYGWMWKIPLQHRIGSGYIFDSDYISEAQALDEAQQYYGQNLEIRKVIPFEAGRFERVWNKNCIAVGLSSHFLEPLESTSLWVTILQLTVMKQFINAFIDPDEHSMKLYNQYFSEVVDESMNFIYFHYMTKRNDSKFWQEFKHKHPLPDKLAGVIDQYRNSNLRYFDGFEKTFPIASVMQVGHGLGIFEKTPIMFGQENITPSPKEYQNLIKKGLETTAIDHDIFIKNLYNKQEELSPKELFYKDGFVHIKKFIPEDIGDLITQYALFDEMRNFNPEPFHELVPNAHRQYGDPAMESILLKIQPFIEQLINKQLYPTYSYFRVYRPGDRLPLHLDRPSCEISATICFNYDYGEDYSWPIYIKNIPVVMQPGDIVLYKGCDLYHERKPLDVKSNSAWHVQGFFHYVDANGPFAEYKFDKRVGIGEKRNKQAYE